MKRLRYILLVGLILMTSCKAITSIPTPREYEETVHRKFLTNDEAENIIYVVADERKVKKLESKALDEKTNSTKTEVQKEIANTENDSIRKKKRARITKGVKIRGTRNNRVKTKNTNTYIIEYDFQKGSYERNNVKPRVGRPIVFKITNINRLAFDVVIKSRDSLLTGSDFASDFLKDLDDFEEKKLESTSLSVPQLTINNINDSDIQVEDEEKEGLKKGLTKIELNRVLTEEKSKWIEERKEIYAKIKAQIQEQLKEIKRNKKTEEIEDTTSSDSGRKYKQLDSLSSVRLEEMELSDFEKIFKENKRYNQYLQDIEEKNKLIKANNDEIEENNKDIEEYLKSFNKDQQELVTVFEKMKANFNKIIHLRNIYYDFRAVAVNPELTYEKYEVEHLEKFNKILVELPNYVEVVEDFQDLSLNVDRIHSKMRGNSSLNDFLNSDGIIKLFAYPNFIKAQAHQLRKEFEEIEIGKKIFYLKQNIQNLQNEESFTVVSIPVQPYKDIAAFDIKIKKRKGNNSSLYTEKSFTHNEFTYGGMRLDLSVGMAGSYFFKAYRYDLIDKGEGDADHNGRFMIAGEKGVFSPTIVGMATVGFRNTSYAALGLTIGLGVDINQTSFEFSDFFVGPSLVLGKFDRFTFTGGATIKRIKQLKSGFEMGQSYDQPELEFYLVPKHRLGFFISVSYNLSRDIKQNKKFIRQFSNL